MIEIGEIIAAELLDAFALNNHRQPPHEVIDVDYEDISGQVTQIPSIKPNEEPQK